MTDPTNDTEATPHHWGGPDEPIEDEYAAHQRREAEAKRAAREQFDLRTLSVQLEDETGADSIPTIERIYRRSGPIDGSSPSVYECVYPDCTFVRREPIKMWKHVHFGTRHGWSFGMSLQHLVAARLEAADA